MSSNKNNDPGEEIVLLIVFLIFPPLALLLMVNFVMKGLTESDEGIASLMDTKRHIDHGDYHVVIISAVLLLIGLFAHAQFILGLLGLILTGLVVCFPIYYAITYFCEKKGLKYPWTKTYKP